MDSDVTDQQRSSCPPLRVCIVSGQSREMVGGLSAYNRELVRHLTAAGVPVSSVWRFDRHPTQAPGVPAAATSGDDRSADGIATRPVGLPPWARPLRRWVKHLTARPALRGLAARAFSVAYGPSLGSSIPADVQIVHFIGNGWELLGFAALRVARQRGAGLTVWPAVHPGATGDTPLDVRLYNQADAVFCQSDHEKDYLARLGVDPRRLVRVWLAPIVESTGNGERFRGKHQLGNCPLILFIARKSRDKGFHQLCQAMDSVVAAVPSARLAVIGPDTEPPSPPVSARVLDLGVASEAEKADALAACDVYCMPSIAESFGLVYTEAWSYGKPVICGPAPASVELVHRCAGGLSTSQEPLAIAAALKTLLTNPELARTLGANGKRFVDQHLTWLRVVDQHMDIFESAMRRSIDREGRVAKKA